MKADHFHCIYEFNAGERKLEAEMEGAFNGLPENWNEMSKEERKEWTRDQAIAWGMPEDATIKNFYIAG